MIQLRPRAARGFADHGWLVARHSFSFADYYDPAEMGWGVLHVINENRVVPGKGFATHGHRDMEIVTYVIAGALEHRDSLGNGEVIHPGEVQRMSASSGVPLEAAPIGDLQGGGLENGVNRASPGSPLVDRALARLPVK
jgi:redox-sensitive bicupin YhaK (pirin superfamily)